MGGARGCWLARVVGVGSGVVVEVGAEGVEFVVVGAAEPGVFFAFAGGAG